MKEHAIKENHLFVKAYRKGRKHVTKHVVVYVLPDYLAKQLRKQNPMKETINRIGFSVSKKNGNAVTRNRCKRVMREGFRAACRERAIKTGYLLVIVAREACASAKTRQICADMTAAFAALNLFVGMPPVFPKDPKSSSAKPKNSQTHKQTIPKNRMPS